MPIPTRTKSVRDTTSSSRDGLNSRKTTRQGPGRDIDTAIASVSSQPNGTSALPQPRKANASALPRVAASHSRVQSLQVTKSSRLDDAPQSSSATPEGSKSSKLTNSTTAKVLNRPLGGKETVGHLRSRSTIVEAAHRSQASSRPAFNTYQQHFTPQKSKPITQPTGKERDTRTVST